MLHNSISVDMKVYALQLKQKSTADFPMEFPKILEQLLSTIIFFGRRGGGREGAASDKKTEEENSQ